jgi:hypothetical protein
MGPKSVVLFRVVFELVNHADLSIGAEWPSGGLCVGAGVPLCVTCRTFETGWEGLAGLQYAAADR